MSKKESFEWINLAEVDKLPKDRLLKIVAKTPATTFHPEDPKYPVRVFAETQLMRNAASLVGRPVGSNHSPLPIFGAYAVDSEWNEQEKQLEALLLVPPQYVKKVADGLITHASVEYTWRDIKDKGKDGKEFIGLSINRIDLLEGDLKDMAGDKRAAVTLFEATKKSGMLLTEITTLGEPFAGYKDIADCIAKNQDKEDPAAYCATIMRKVEVTTPVQKAEALVVEVQNLTDGLRKVTGELKIYKETTNKLIEAAVQEEKTKIITAVESVIPKNFIARQSNQGMIRLTRDIRKVLKTIRE